MGKGSAPYNRTWKHTGKRGRETVVTCGYCGRKVPKHKTFTKHTGFRITDPALKKQLKKSQVRTFSRKIYVCPACARFHHVVRVGRSRKSRHVKKKRRKRR